jgi:hypothetical protein
MTSQFSIRALTDGVFSYGCGSREILVLKAFFDDSGTHDRSDVIVMGGIIAPEESWLALEPPWQAELDRLGITAMHMSHCEARRGEFQDMERDQRDAIIAFFSNLICATKGRMLASAVSRRVWNSVAAQTKLGEVFAEPIDFLFNTCMRRALESRRTSNDGPEEVVVTFDTRDQNLRFWEDLAAGYEKRWPSRLVGYSFGQMAKVLPLQAADMIAYESFVHQCQFEKTGENFSHRPNMVKLMECLAVWAGFYDEENLLEYARKLVG